MPTVCTPASSGLIPVSHSGIMKSTQRSGSEQMAETNGAACSSLRPYPWNTPATSNLSAAGISRISRNSRARSDHDVSNGPGRRKVALAVDGSLHGHSFPSLRGMRNMRKTAARKTAIPAYCPGVSPKYLASPMRRKSRKKRTGT